MKMKKNLLAVLLIASLCTSAFTACSKDKEIPDDTQQAQNASDVEIIDYELTFVDVDDSDDNGTAGLEEQATMAPTEAENQTETETNDAGEVVTQAPTEAPTEAALTTVTNEDGIIFAVVTEPNGETATDASGETETVPYTTDSTSVTTTTANGGSSSYTASPKERRALWLNMDKKEDYVFNGEFLTASFELKDDIQDGLYEISISHTDFANYDAETLPSVGGKLYIAVNTDVPADEEITSDGIVVSGKSVSAKPGDTVSVTFEIKNNPGVVGFVLGYTYDTNAMTLVKNSENALGEYADVIAEIKAMKK